MKPRRSITAVAALMLVIAACGATPAEPDTEIQTTVAEPTTTHPHPTTTMSDAGHDDHMDHEEEPDSGHDEADAETRTVNVVMNEFTFSPESVTVSAGETVRFVIVNEGTVPHEFRLSNQHRIEEHLASGHDDHGDEGGHHDEGGDLLIELAAGDTGELVVTFPDDVTVYTELACLLPGHYEAGMKGSVTYE